MHKMENINQNTNLIPVEKTNNELPKNGLLKNNSSIDFYVNIDRNYVPVAGANKILPVEYVSSFSGINSEDIIGVRSIVKDETNSNKKKIVFSLIEKKNYSFEFKDFEVVLYQNTGTSFEPTKILRIIRKEYNDRPEPFYGVKDSQRNGTNDAVYYEKK